MRRCSLFAVVLTALFFVSLRSGAAEAASERSNDLAVSGQMTSATVGGEGVAAEVEVASDSIFLRAWRGGFVVFTVLLLLVLLSVASWALMVAKYIYLRQVGVSTASFMKSFWDSRSLNDLNAKLGEHPYSPAKEVFRVGYAELVRGTQLRESAYTPQLAIHAALENLTRSLRKASQTERKKMEQYVPFLATIASASPFIGLFGTVWGIMGAFEGIAQTGSASLAAVAPGISEALIATAFGLAAAIPALVGYNIANAKIRSLWGSIDGFSADFMNIVERYLITDRSRTSAGHAGPLDHSPL